MAHNCQNHLSLVRTVKTLFGAQTCLCSSVAFWFKIFKAVSLIKQLKTSNFCLIKSIFLNPPKNYLQKSHKNILFAMAKVQLCNITVMDNPSPFLNPFQFEITFECIEELKEDLEWKMIYVGSAESEEYDQVLDSVFVGPIPEGKHMFVFQADPPNVSRIPENDALGVTVVLLTCSYRAQEFIRVGYFINNEYSDPELKENPPIPTQFDKVTRNILASEPRVTRFKINWEEPTSVNGQEPGPSENTDAIVAESSMQLNNESGAPVPSFNENSNSWATMECS